MMSDAPQRQTGRTRTVVLDANVLIPNSLRDTLLRAAEQGWYDPYWSTSILTEIERNLTNRILLGRPDPAAAAQRLIAAIRATFPTATVPEDARLIATLTNHPGDRHVLAAAIQVGAGTIVTRNLRDFPRSALAPHGIVAQPPDRFLQRLFTRDPAAMVQLLIDQGADLRPARTLDTILGTIGQHAPGFVRLIREYSAR